MKENKKMRCVENNQTNPHVNYNSNQKIRNISKWCPGTALMQLFRAHHAHRWPSTSPQMLLIMTSFCCIVRLFHKKRGHVCIDPKQAVSVTTDGGPAMVGKEREAVTRMKEDNPKCEHRVDTTLRQEVDSGLDLSIGGNFSSGPQWLFFPQLFCIERECKILPVKE